MNDGCQFENNDNVDDVTDPAAEAPEGLSRALADKEGVGVLVNHLEGEDLDVLLHGLVGEFTADETLASGFSGLFVSRFWRRQPLN